ncbi:hypothetical protein [Pedobacter mendelii]|uniref:DUF4488 domain-containing protein n=1 Tax=Pedobacter mendelii TaxID=1908240 RepID=A0ABQ2BCJ3_9SPHI|nr:hypothetical protein [Pedobacter mendelii]GGI22799.1 hypothetical protein GCM10008119_04450 [Pedobacter mendelii]
MCFIFICLILLSCNLEASRKDIEAELQGKWRGEWISKTLKDTTVVKTTLKIDKNVFYYNMGGHTGSNKIRMFINPINGDTLIERKHFMNSLLTESGYMKYHRLSKNEIRLYFVFKMNDKQFINDNLAGYYMKRVE